MIKYSCCRLPYPAGKGVSVLVELSSFIVSVMANVVAGVITYYVCKLLDGDKKNDKIGNQHEG